MCATATASPSTNPILKPPSGAMLVCTRPRTSDTRAQTPQLPRYRQRLDAGYVLLGYDDDMTFGGRRVR